MVIQHNLLAMNSNRMLGITNGKMANKTEKLSSGYRINRAADDAAGLSISEKMRWMIRGLHQGTENTQDGISFVQIGDGAMGEIHDMINRMEELAVKAANGTLTDDDRSYIDSEVQQLKKQINSINRTTVFNELPIFDSSSFINVNGIPNDLSLFDASYDDATGDFSYGGFIFNGERVTWNTVDADMIDSNGLFTGGTYTYGAFTITTKPGDTVPNFSRNVSISASSSGVTIDGTNFTWDKLHDEDGNKCSASNVHSGAWMLDYKGAEVTFYINDDIETLDELGDAIDRANNKNNKVHYAWDENYDGDIDKKAVDVTSISRITVSNSLADTLIANPSISLTVKADNDGIYLQDDKGSKITGSEKSWADMNISSWNSGTDISSSKNYKYSYSESGNELLSFNFTLCDETSVDSVIDGLDNMKINASSIKTSYSTKGNNTSDNTKMTFSIRNNVDIKEEHDLGRDFSNKSDLLKEENVAYDSGNHNATLTFKDASDNPIINFIGDTTPAESTLSSKLDAYLTKIANLKLKNMELGTEYKDKTLPDVVGSDNITQSGYFASTFKYTASMNGTDGAASIYSPGKDGNTYATAFIDFKNLNSAEDIKQLVGTGFDSTCKTCSNHYSVIFTDSITGGTTTSDNYTYKRTNGSNYLLEIDINSLTNNGVDNGEKLANAFVKIASESFDFHYTQYAADGSKLYIFDDRAQSFAAKDADFWTAPYNPETSVSMSTKLNHDNRDGDYVQLNYTYDITSLSDRVKVSEIQDNTSGEYIKNSDLTGDLADKGYTKYNASDPAHAAIPNRYNLVTTYLNSDDSVATDKASAINNITKNTINDILTKSSVDLSFTNYTYIDASGNENVNIAKAPVFSNDVYKVGDEEGIYIVHSGMPNDKTFIPRFSMNTAAMGLSNARTKTVSDALKTMDYTKRANEYVSSKRSLYGALQNRMEHTLNNNMNKEENMQAAESRIRDTDMATEMVAYSIQNILAQAGQSMLTQANQSKEGILSLLG